jgi:cytoskeletal protein CcmA (bactofilin family)
MTTLSHPSKKSFLSPDSLANYLKKFLDLQEAHLTEMDPHLTTEGNITVEQALYLSGKHQGEIIGRPLSLIVLTPTSHVSGQIHGDEVIIEGHFEGTIEASHLIHLTASATVKGSLISKNIKIDTGALFDGTTTLVSDLTLNVSDNQID